MKKFRVWWWRSWGAGHRDMMFKEVNNIEEAKKVLRRLTAEDLKDKNIITNGGGLEVFEKDGSWSEYYDELGRDIWEIIEDEKAGYV